MNFVAKGIDAQALSAALFAAYLCMFASIACKKIYEEIPPDLPESIVPLGRVDYEWRIRSLDGTEYCLGQFRRRKLFINLWACWCVHG